MLLYKMLITKATVVATVLFLTGNTLFSGGYIKSVTSFWESCFTGAKACNFDIVYDNQSYTAKGVTDRFLSLTKFNAKNEECWAGFAEYYYNMVPDNPNTVIQNVYVFESKDVIQIKSIQQYKTSKSKLNLIAIGYLNQKKEILTFKRMQ